MSEQMPLREIVARVLCERGGSWNTKWVFTNNGDAARERAEFYRSQADQYLARVVPATDREAAPK